MNSGPILNFGENLSLQPAAYYEPRDEAEVLSILNRHRDQSIRAIGKLHSWSEAPGGDGVVLNLLHFQQVTIQEDSAVVGAGCQIKTLLARLNEQQKTLPSVGLITEQTIAGAVSTGTHGSGRHCLSQYVLAIRLARYDDQGNAIIEEIHSGLALEAARCSLGCLGILLSVTMQIRPAYSVEEHFREHKTIEDVMKSEQRYPLQQFFLIPWRWTFIAQHRREVPPQRSRLAGAYRIYWRLCIDWGLHLLILNTLRLAGRKTMRFLFRWIIPNTILYHTPIADDSTAMLVMEHHLFRHIETEIFVTGDQLAAALDLVRGVLSIAGMSKGVVETELDETEQRELEGLRNSYGHHYPICVRKVLGDSTLISMAAGDRAWYAISLITYEKPSQRRGFMNVMEFLARALAKRFGARPHWGKYCPLTASELVALYPRFPEFKSLCESHDPGGRFRNRWLNSLFAASS